MIVCFVIFGLNIRSSFAGLLDIRILDLVRRLILYVPAELLQVS